VIRWINAQGERKSRLVKVHSIKAAREALTAEKLRVEEELRFGRPTPTEETFKTFVVVFLAYQEKRISARVVKGKLSQSEFNRQKGIINGPLVPFFGSKKLASVGRKDVAEHIDLRTGVAGDGTIIKEVNVLKRMFNVAMEFEKLPPTPHRELTFPKPRKGASVTYCRATWAGCSTHARSTTAPALKRKHAQSRISLICRSLKLNSGFKTLRDYLYLSAPVAANYCSHDGKTLT